MTRSGRLQIYRTCEPVVDVQYDPDDRQALLEVLAEGLAEASGVTAMDLPPLYETIDVEAITDLFSGDRDDGDKKLVSFSHENWNVFVRGDGRVRICDDRKELDPVPVFETPRV
jgi:hypothetical protein